MPYASPAQSRFIHMKASEGVGWAKKFVNDSKGTKVFDQFTPPSRPPVTKTGGRRPTNGPVRTAGATPPGLARKPGQMAPGRYKRLAPNYLSKRNPNSRFRSPPVGPVPKYPAY